MHSRSADKPATLSLEKELLVSIGQKTGWAQSHFGEGDKQTNP
jgi:hypothetical protein